MSVYGVKPPVVAQACRNLLALPNLECENEARLLQTLDGVAAGIDWFDALLWAAAPTGVVMATFDKPFAKRAAGLGWNVEVRVPKAR